MMTMMVEEKEEDMELGEGGIGRATEVVEGVYILSHSIV